jgi:subtilisin family serine protease
MGAEVINMSLAGYGRSEAQARAVNYAWNTGTVVVAAAGNDATNQPAYPAAYTNAIAVSGTDYHNGDSNFSNYGSWVDVAAPAGELQGSLSAARYQILSTYPTYFNSSGYNSQSGTSFACPMVSGVVALLALQNRSAAQVQKRLQSTATDFGAVGRDNLFGTGLVNARAAVGSSLTSSEPANADRTLTTTDKKLGTSAVHLQEPRLQTPNNPECSRSVPALWMVRATAWRQTSDKQAREGREERTWRP